MEVETETNVYEQYEEYVTQLEVKQSDDISAEVDDEKNFDVISAGAGGGPCSRVYAHLTLSSNPHRY